MGAESLVSSLPGAGTAGAMLDLLPTGVSLVELGTARVLYANRKAHMLAGGELPLSDGAGDYSRLYPCTDAEGRPVSSDDMPGPRIARREPFTAVRLDWATPESVRTVLVSGQLTHLPDGTEVGVVTFEDVTSLEKERRRARLLASAAARLADSLDLAETLAAVAAVTLPAFADWCFVEMCCADGSIKRVLVEHRDPDKRAFIEEYDRRYPLDPDAPIGSDDVIRTGRPALVTDITDELLTAVATDPEQLRLLQGAGFRSSVIVPLRVRGVVIGDLALATAESGRRYEEADVPVVQELADRCAMAIDNARLHGEIMDAETAARDAQSRAEAMLAG